MADPSAVAKAHSAATKAFNSIGRSNGSACPTPHDNIDPLLHEFYIAATLQAAAKARYDKAKDSLLDDEETGLGVEQAALKVKEGQSGTLQTSSLYTLTLKHNNGSDMTDVDAFISALRREGVSQDVITKALARAKKRRAGAKNYSVSPNL